MLRIAAAAFRRAFQGSHRRSRVIDLNQLTETHIFMSDPRERLGLAQPNGFVRRQKVGDHPRTACCRFLFIEEDRKCAAHRQGDAFGPHWR